jgi:hypothetical protein
MDITTEISHSENVARDRQLYIYIQLYKEYYFLFILFSLHPPNTIVESNRLVINVNVQIIMQFVFIFMYYVLLL